MKVFADSHLAQFISGFVVALVGSIVFLFETFATKGEVQDKSMELKSRVLEIREDLRETRSELNQKLDQILIKTHK